jgi:hypothetical protein
MQEPLNAHFLVLSHQGQLLRRLKESLLVKEIIIENSD